MIRFLSAAVLILASYAFALTPVAVAPASQFAPFRLDDPQVKAYHHIHFNTGLEGDSCSSAAVGPHALLTATHCELGTDDIDIDGVTYAIAKRLRDKADHTILILPAANFTVTLAIDQRAFHKGERVRGWGWPGNYPNVIYKEGYVLGFNPEVSVELGLPAWFFAYPTFPGDSGGAVISDEGKVITVVSLGDDAAHMVAFPFQFTPDQLAEIR